jgi:FMN-dependent NADH-azoreductase
MDMIGIWPIGLIDAMHQIRRASLLAVLEGSMHRLLFVTSSLFAENSKSRLIGAEFVAAWRQAHPGTTVVERVLSADSIPHLTQATFTAASTPTESRSAEQQAEAAFADALIEELEAADVIVIAAPMYNFTISSTLKAWLDHVVRAGRTFSYTAAGPEGLLRDKKVFVTTARGGVYSAGSPGNALDFQEPYLRVILGFVGLTDVTFVHTEGLARGPDSAERGLAEARRAVAALVPAARAA